MTDANLWDRIQTFIVWTLMSFTWFIGIFWKKVYEHNEDWLVNYGKDKK